MLFGAALLLAFMLALCCAAEEEEEPIFGMGRRHYFGEGRLDIKYVTPSPEDELATPHIDWADPYISGPVKVFAVPSVMEGRTLIELMQRLSMEVDAVTIDPAWDVNKWTMSFGEAYGARSEQNEDGSLDYSLTYKYLEEDLTSDRTWEVMVTHGIVGWEHLPQAVREAVMRRVRDGMGLVIVGPLGLPGDDSLRELSPLLPTSPETENPVPGGHRGRQAGLPGEWTAEGEHYITAGIPLDTLPGEHLRHQRYTAAPKSQVLATAGGDPVVAVRQVGKGRVVAFGYQNYGLAPFVTWDAYGEVGDSWWETWYSLLIRAIVWAARREPQVCLADLRLEPGSASAEDEAPVQFSAAISGKLPARAGIAWQVRDDDGAIALTGEEPLTGETASFAIPVAALAGGRHLLDVFLLSDGKRVDWATLPLSVMSPVSVTAVAAEPAVVTEDRPVKATVSLSGPLPSGAKLVVELVDNYQRVLARDTNAAFSDDGRTAVASLASDDLLTHIGWVRAAVQVGDRMLSRSQVRVDFATPERLRTWDDYEVNVPFYGPQNYYHWMPLLDRQFRRCGVTWLMEPERNFRFTVLAQVTGLGVYHYNRKPFDEQMAAYWRTGDRKYLERKPCLHRDWRQTAARELKEKMAPYLKYRPFHYYIYDEPSLTSYTRAFEFCFTPETRAAFREWLSSQYGTLEALNEEWGTSHQAWDEIEPVTADEAREKDLIPAWVDFRRFMDTTLAEAFKYTQQVVDELDPGALTLVGGTQRPTPFDGTDWWLMSHAIGILEPYFGIPEFHSFNPDLPIIQACGYQDAGPELEEELWRRALQGQKGATIFWNYTMLDPDLALNSQGTAMQRAFGALRGDGIARLLLGARRDHCRVAFLYSQPSMLASWIQDGDVRAGRSEAARRAARCYRAWAAALRRSGLQYHCISYQQLAENGLSRDEFDLLVLPPVVAMSDAEAEHIRRFIASGGVVISDCEAGAYDEHGKPRSSPALGETDGMLITPLPTDGNDIVSAAAAGLSQAVDKAGIRPPAQVSPGSPELVRFTDGEAEYLGIAYAPAEPHHIVFQRKAHVYDVREGRYLGEVDRIDVRPERTRVALYALLPEPVTAVTVEPAGPATRGAEMSYRVAVNAEAGSYRHVFAVHVYGPDGEVRHMYGRNLDAPQGSAEGVLRFAWNDPVGEWRLVVRDAATGVTGETRFNLE